MLLRVHAPRVPLLAVLLLVLVPATGFADTINIVTGDFRGVLVGYFFQDDPVAPFARAEIGSVDMASGPGALSDPFEAYCVDIAYSFEQGVVDLQVAPISTWSDPLQGSSNPGAKAAYLYNQYNPLIEGNTGLTPVTIPGFTPPPTVTVTADLARTALAMAIWEVLDQSGANPSTCPTCRAAFTCGAISSDRTTATATLTLRSSTTIRGKQLSWVSYRSAISSFRASAATSAKPVG